MRAILLALILALAASPAAADVFRSGAWLAICDNARSCQITALPDGVERRLERGVLKIDPGFHLVLKRSGEADASAAVSVGVNLSTLPRSRSGRTLRWGFLIDGKPAKPFETRENRFAFCLAHDPCGDTASAWFPRDDGLAFLALLQAGGRVLTVRQPNGVSGDIPLAGLTETLRWVDAQQLRSGGVTALADRGDRPASDIPPVPALPVVRAATLPSQAGLPALPPGPIRALLTLEECPDRDIPERDPQQAAMRLAPGLVLWAPACRIHPRTWVHARRFFLADETGAGARPLDLPLPAGVTRYDVGDLVFGWIGEGGVRAVLLWPRQTQPGELGCRPHIGWVWTGEAFTLVDAYVDVWCMGLSEPDRPYLHRSDYRDAVSSP